MNANTRTMMSASVDYDKDGLQFGTIRLPNSVHRSAYGHVAIPVCVAKNGEGPTVLLTGGVHGDEYEGPIILSRLARTMDMGRLRGRVIIIPTLNHPAFVAGNRMSPLDGINLNRTFPGRRDGSPTEAIAHYVTTELLPKADYLLDFHSGGSSLQYLPILLAPRSTDSKRAAAIEALVNAFAPPRVVYFDAERALSGEDRVIGNYAHQNNVLFLTGEFGGGSSVNREGLGVAERGLRAVLAHLEVLSEDNPACERVEIERLVMDDPGLYATATRRGFFEPLFTLGDEVPAGAVAGYIYDIDRPWQEPEPIHFRASGVAVCIRTFALVEAGDCLGHLAARK